MQVTELTSDLQVDVKTLRRATAEELRNEFKFTRAKQITGMMLSLGLITDDEYQRIMAENTSSFPTFLSAIL